MAIRPYPDQASCALINPKTLRDAVRQEHGLSRRLFLSYAAALTALPWVARQDAHAAVSTTFPSADPFPFGVASGDPDSTSVVLWTRLANKPLDPDGGMARTPIRVDWELAEDDAMKKVVRRGVETATPQLGHSVHAVAEHLQPDRWYWYRFRCGDAETRIGRTRTMPRPDTLPGSMKFAFGSCQHYESGYYTAYEQMMKDELDLVLFIGDYIYDNGRRVGGTREHVGGECRTLYDYRIRYSLYRLDPLLSGMHAACPWIVTNDDHEVENNWANDRSERPNVDPADFLLQRAAAFQAFYEMMPFRPRSIPAGPMMQIYRRASFGTLADFHVLDTRQYRSPLLKGKSHERIDDETASPQRTILGEKQRNWLHQSLLRSKSTWNVLAQQIMMGMWDRDPGPDQNYAMDQWPGYFHDRKTLLEFMRDRKVLNPVVLTGDIHSNWVNDLRADDRKMELPVIATEFVGTSISSSGKQHLPADRAEKIRALNPFVKFQSTERGYVRCTLTPETWTSDFIEVEDVTKRQSRIFKQASFVVESGIPGAKPA